MNLEENQNDCDWEFEDTDERDELFTIATQQIQRTHDKILPNDLLELYGLYKQATVGKCNICKPGILRMQARAKWSAWHDLNDMPSDKAKELYVEKVRELDPKWYENIQNGITPATSRTGWVTHSIELPPHDHNSKAEHEKDIFDFVKDDNIKRIRETIQNSDLHIFDEHGMGLIHWATDYNNLNILEFLLLSGCSVNLLDGEQQTALHYASSCGHFECVKLLLQYGADKTIKDREGHTAIDVADDLRIRSLLQSQ